jgi:putative oxidoreductase
MHNTADIMVALGRVLLGGLFVAGGIRHFFITDAVVPMIAARGLPMPKAVLYVGSIFQTAAGALLMFGLFVMPVAMGLIVFTLAASVMLLNFWEMEKGPARTSIINVWLSNIAIIGGLLIAAARAG